MAEFRLSYKRGKVGYAKNHAAYILREKEYKVKEDLVYKEYGNLPLFCGNNALDFWSAADEFEGINRNAYREFELNIPNELNHSEAINLIKDFVNKEIGTDFPYTFAIHESFNENGEKNLHCHLMFSERKIDNIEREKELFFKKANSKNPELGGVKKDRTWKSKDRLLALRKSWEIFQNNSLEKNGIIARVDCRSLAARRKEALEQGNIKKAESLERNPVNINGKLLRKLKAVGYAKLNEEEKKQVDRFNKAKHDKRIKERKLKIRKGLIIPTEKEIVDRINEIDKLDEGAIKRLAINILSKGQLNKNYYELRRTEKMLIASPENKALLDKKEKLKTNILNIVDTHIEIYSYKYPRIVEQIKRDLAAERERHIYNLKNTYKKEFKESNQVFENENKKKLYVSLKEELSKKSTLELMYKLEDNSSSHYKAIQILTKYRFEAISKNNILLKQDLEEKNKKLVDSELFNNKEDLKKLKNDIQNINNQIEKNNSEYLKILTELNKQHNQEELERLKNFIEYNSKIEKEAITNILAERKKDLSNEEKIEQHLNLITDLKQSNKLYNYFLNKNQEEKYNKSISKLDTRIEAITNIIEKSDFNSIPIKEKNKILSSFKEKEKEKINILIPKENTYIKGISELEKLLSKDPVKYNLSSVELMTVNKISKGEFSKNYKLIENLEEERKKLKEKYEKSSFLTKPFVKKDLIKNEEQLNIYISKEKEIINHVIKLKRFNTEKEKITINLNNSLQKMKNELKIISADKFLSFNKLKTIKELENKEYSKNKKLKLSLAPLNTLKKLGNWKELSFNLKKLLNNQEDQGYNALDINLEKERKRERGLSL